jgi:hypothetical protein
MRRSFTTVLPFAIAAVFGALTATGAHGQFSERGGHIECGPNQSYLSAAEWDFCTGLGSPLGKSGK